MASSPEPMSHNECAVVAHGSELRNFAKGRERWWAAVKADQRMPAREELTDAEQAPAE